MRIAVFGLTITSSWGNGHATLWRGLCRALARLKPSQREMLWLAYAQGSSHEEIAEVLGLTRASVKALLFRARRKMADLLRGGAR